MAIICKIVYPPNPKVNMPLKHLVNPADRHPQSALGTVSMREASNAMDRLRAAAGIPVSTRPPSSAVRGRAGQPTTLTMSRPEGQVRPCSATRKTPVKRPVRSLVQRALDGIALEEHGDGTAANPGAHAKRAALKQMLDTGRRTNGGYFSAGERKLLQARMIQLSDSVQRLQYRKATLRDVDVPPARLAALLQEGKRLISPSGHVWRKKDGIIYRSA